MQPPYLKKIQITDSGIGACTNAHHYQDPVLAQLYMYIEYS